MSEEVREKKPKVEKKEENKASTKTTSEKKKNTTEKKTTKKADVENTSLESKSQVKKTAKKSSPEKSSKTSKLTDKSKVEKTSSNNKSDKKTTVTSKTDAKKTAQKEETKQETKTSDKKKTTTTKKKNDEKKADTAVKEEKVENKKIEKKENQVNNASVDANEDIKTELMEEIKQKKEKTKNAAAEKEKEQKNNENKDETEETSLVDESKYDTVSLKEIREALETKIDKPQRKSVIKDVFINISIALAMTIYLSVIMIIYRNLEIDVLAKITRISTLAILFIGLTLLEISYKKDNTKIAMNAIEVIAFGASNLCLIYTIRLYIDNLKTIMGYIIVGIVAYYIIKSLFLTILSVKKFKNENNDIKDIVAKKKKEED